MTCGKCGKCYRKSSCLCPVSFGLALGLVSGVTVFLWSLWMMYNGLPPMMAGHVPPPTVMGGLTHGLWALLKGFIFGFFVALIYDFFACYCKAMCCKKSSETCECGSSDKPANGK